MQAAHSDRASLEPPTRHVVLPLLPAALAGFTCWFAGKLALALLRRHRRLGQQNPSPALVAASAGVLAALPDLASLDAANPAAFFLPDPGLAALADCFAVVQGVRLPLHSQVSASAGRTHATHT